MKIYIKCKNNELGNQTELVLKSDALVKGHEVVATPIVADVVWHQVDNFKEISEVRNYSIYKNFEGNFVYFENKSGKLKVYKLNDNKNNSDFYYKVETERKEVVVNYTQQQIDKLEKEIVDYLLGKGDKIEVLDPFLLISVFGLALFSANKNRNQKVNLYDFYKNKLGVTDQEIEILIQEYKDAQRFGDSELLRMIRNCKEIYSNFMPIEGVTNNVILNTSDSVIQNLFKMLNDKCAIYNINYSKTKSSESEYWKTIYENQFKDETNKLVATVREAITGSKNSFTTSAKDTELQMGVYSLYIPDNSLKDGEILIPHPKHMGINSQVIKLNGNTITILHTRRCVVIDGPDAYNPEIIKRYSTGKFTGYEVYQDKIVLEKIREYPMIGDDVIATRHPITTLICRLKVVGYTNDGSIRCNVRTALALKGDADGDSWSVSWSKWTDSLIYADAVEIDKYCKTVGLELEKSDFDHSKLDINDFINLKPATVEECVEKSSESGLEQASAKVKTKKLTGKFGAVVRDIVQTLIINGIKSDYDMVEGEASISQTLVQLKNNQKDLLNGIIPEQLVKDFYCIYLMKDKDLKETATMLSELIDIPLSKAISLIEEWFELNGNTIEEIIEETSTKDSFIEKFQSFFD